MAGLKIDGLTLKQFLEDKAEWPGDTYYEEEEIFVDGVAVDADTDISKVYDGAAVAVNYGVMYLDGDMNKAVSMPSRIRAWLKKRSMVRLLVEVPREYEAAMRNAIKHHNGFVI